MVLQEEEAMVPGKSHWILVTLLSAGAFAVCRFILLVALTSI